MHGEREKFWKIVAVLLLLILSLIALYVFCASRVQSLSSCSCKTSDGLQTIITLNHYQGTFSSAINEIAKQCNLNSDVSHELVDKQIELDIHNQSAEFALNNICFEFRCTWEVEDGSVNVYKKWQETGKYDSFSYSTFLRTISNRGYC